MKFYVPPQLTRLAIAFTVFISLFIFLRHLLVPVSFGQYGHYRGNSLIEISQLETHYAGQQACFDCHQDIEDMKSNDAHKSIHCETCHGPGQKHVASGEAADIFKPESREFCAVCHQKNAAKRVTTIVQIDIDDHYTGKKCIECHNPHKPWDVKQ